MALPGAKPETTEDHALRLVAEQACRRAGAATAGMTVVRGDDPALVVGTSLLGHQLEQAQLAAGHGPGLDAIRQLQVFNVDCLATNASWPAFTPVAVSRGVRSSLAVPIILHGRALGVLDLYSLDPGAFEGAEQVGLHFAAEAAKVLSGNDVAADGDERRPTLRRPGRSQAVS